MWILLTILIFLVGVAIYDLTQKNHAILRSFPIIGHLRYILEAFGPELRQYIVTSNDEEQPFNRDQRRWVYASSKKQNNYFGFGSDDDMEHASNYLIIKHSAFPLPTPHPGDPDYDPDYSIPCAKVLGRARKRTKAFRPPSVLNVSGMSFGSLSAPAVKALNLGCQKSGCLHNTGEGGVSPHHLLGGELIWQIGTGYFGCRTPEGVFSMDKLEETVASAPIRAIEIKLSQGAKPGLGGILPAAKITEEIAAIRGIPMGLDCRSPSSHSAFSDIDSMLDFVEAIADRTGLPVGIKSAVGDDGFWNDLAKAMAETDRGVDFVAVDGGEGGTGAGPLVFTDHVALPFKMAMARVISAFAEQDLHGDVAFIGSGKLGFPESALLAFALGCDMIHVGREPMMAIGCIQAQRCHNGHCPTGVATQNAWLTRGLDWPSKADRLANYMTTLRKEILSLCRACGVPHPSQITGDHLEILDDRFGSTPVSRLFRVPALWTVPTKEQTRD